MGPPANFGPFRKLDHNYAVAWTLDLLCVWRTAWKRKEENLQDLPLEPLHQEGQHGKYLRPWDQTESCRSGEPVLHSATRVWRVGMRRQWTVETTPRTDTSKEGLSDKHARRGEDAPGGEHGQAYRKPVGQLQKTSPFLDVKDGTLLNQVLLKLNSAHAKVLNTCTTAATEAEDQMKKLQQDQLTCLERLKKQYEDDVAPHQQIYAKALEDAKEKKESIKSKLEQEVNKHNDNCKTHQSSAGKYTQSAPREQTAGESCQSSTRSKHNKHRT